VVGNLLQRLLSENVRVRPRLFNRFRIVWPIRRQPRSGAEAVAGEWSV
jgi:hypothetical protein